MDTRTDAKVVDRFALEVRIMHRLGHNHLNLPRTVDSGVALLHSPA
jgi:hypothetical protein